MELDTNHDTYSYFSA